MEVDIIIDKSTHCLERKSNGQICNTEFRKRDCKITKNVARQLKREGWLFDWSIPAKHQCDVYELFLKNDPIVQGRIALKHITSQYYTYVDIVESAPHNLGENKEFIGVGSHLFAIACKLSWDVGNEGYVQFVAKTDLVSHYKKALGAQHIDGNTLFLDTHAASVLINAYFKEGDLT